MFAIIVVFVTWIVFTLLIFFALHYLFPTKEFQPIYIFGTWVDEERNIYIISETKLTIGLKEGDEYQTLVEDIKIRPVKHIHWIIPGLSMKEFVLIGDDKIYNISITDECTLVLKKDGDYIATLTREIV